MKDYNKDQEKLNRESLQKHRFREMSTPIHG